MSRWIRPALRSMLRLVAALMLVMSHGHVEAQTVIIEHGSPVSSIAEGLRLATDGARLIIRPGVYRENALVINRSIEIIGEEGAIVDGGGDAQILTIAADNVTIRGLLIRNVKTSFVEDRSAIEADGVSGCIIENNRLEDTFFGIYLARTSDCRVTGNRIFGSGVSESRSGNGIHLWYSRQVTIEDNVVVGHRDGIYLEFVEDSPVNRNEMASNHRYGLHFMFSNRCSYRDNVLRANGAGVAVMYTSHVVMEGNRFEHNWGSASYGLLLKDITDSRVAHNVFEDNTVGIYLEGSNRIDIVQNRFSRSGWAIKIMANAQGNRFEGNAFHGNSFDVSTNSRHNNSAFRGNFWDTYRGYDLDRDGVGDVPFRPVRLFSLIVERSAPALILMRSFFIGLLDAAEQVFPSLTPETLVDEAPLMRSPL